MAQNSRFAVAVHTLAAVGFLKLHGVQRASSRQIAQSVNTNAVVIRELLRSLKKAGLIHSKEGSTGGVSLARPPSRITLRDIYLAVEDSSAFGLNLKPEFKPCPVSRGIKRIMPSLFAEVDRAISGTLQRHTLKQVIDHIAALD
jgi:Rrf2 family protein